MKTVLVYSITSGSNLKTLEEIFKLDADIELEFKSKVDFQENYIRFGDLLSLYPQKIIGLKGPSIAIYGSTLFEDTVFIASALEDIFNIDLSYITTMSVTGSAHIEELADFYNNIKTINVIPAYRALDKEEDPIDMAFRIRKWNETGLTNIGMIFHNTFLDKGWKDKDILYSLSSYINQIALKIPVHFDHGECYDLILVKNLYCINKDTIITLDFDEHSYSSHFGLIAKILKHFAEIYK